MFPQSRSVARRRVFTPPVSQRGGTFIEFVFAFPVFMMLVLGLIWYAWLQNARVSVSSGIANGIRLASTRGFAHVAGQHLISAVRDFKENGDSAIQEYVRVGSAQEIPWDDNFVLQVQGKLVALNTLSELRSLPYPYLYSLVYAAQAFHHSIGSSLRFPCDPNLPTSSNPPAGEGCGRCYFLNPVLDNDGGNIPSDEWFLQPYVDPLEDLPVDRIGIECEYRPPGLLFGAFNRLARLITGDPSFSFSPVIRRRKFQDFTEFVQ